MDLGFHLLAAADHDQVLLRARFHALHLFFVPYTCFSCPTPVCHALHLFFMPYTCLSCPTPVFHALHLFFMPYTCFSCPTPVFFMPYTCSLFSGMVAISRNYFLVSPAISISFAKRSFLRTLRVILTEMVDYFPGFVALFEEGIGEC